MKETYTAPKATIISFKIAEDLMGGIPGGDASIVPGHDGQDD